jgi:hypothetical protein
MGTSLERGLRKREINSYGMAPEAQVLVEGVMPRRDVKGEISGARKGKC